MRGDCTWVSFDLEAMTQVNRKTGTELSLRVVSQQMELDEGACCASPPQVWKRPKLRFASPDHGDDIPFQIWLGGRWRDFGRHQADQMREEITRGDKIMLATVRPGGPSVLTDLVNLRQTSSFSHLPMRLGSKHARALRRMGSAPSTTSVVDPITEGICFSADIEDPSVMAFACAVQEWCLRRCGSKFQEERTIATERFLSAQGNGSSCVERFFHWKLLPVACAWEPALLLHTRVFQSKGHPVPPTHVRVRSSS